MGRPHQLFDIAPRTPLVKMFKNQPYPKRLIFSGRPLVGS